MLGAADKPPRPIDGDAALGWCRSLSKFTLRIE